VADLKGKVVATNAAGSAVDIASRYMLKKGGLEDKRDYTTVEARGGKAPEVIGARPASKRRHAGVDGAYEQRSENTYGRCRNR
jgi:hypothetical protein